MITRQFAQQFAREWIEAWNSHDLDRILSHYTDDFEMTSPRIIDVVGEPTGKLKGKDRVRAYWQRALAKNPDLRFELIEVLWSIDTICIYYQSVRGLHAVEWLRIGSEGKAVNAAAHYNDLPT
ncbi:MAG TPA: nuclear transport factor 2 family protein [Verrucomicrobiae bacterium]|nr:nuclear transport factor 2 family protein [Verrucomicrobiae bacterium]